MTITSGFDLVPQSFFDVAKEISFDEDSSVNEGWFIPFLPIEDRVYSEMFLVEWLKFGSYQGEFDHQWRSRLEYLLDTATCPREEHYGRVTASIFAWFGSNVGRSEMFPLIERLQKSKNPSFGEKSNKVVALNSWNQFNSRTPGGQIVLGNLLKSILLKDKLEDLTYFELNLAQTIFIYLSESEGLRFLLKVKSMVEEHEKLR